MLYAGLDLSRQRLDVHVLGEEGQTVEVTAVRPGADALRTLVDQDMAGSELAPDRRSEGPAETQTMSGGSVSRS
jgi:hypothetical protein